MIGFTALLFILLAASSVALILNDQVESVLAPTLFGMALCVYLFGVFDALALGFWVLLLAVAGLTAYAAARHGRKGLLKALVGLSSPGIIIFIVFAVLLNIVTRDMQLAHYDEFSHWGRVARAMFLHDALGPHNPVDLGFRSYPPASATFEYVIMKFAGSWSEGTLFWAYQLLCGAVFVPFMKGLRWRDHVGIAASAFLLFATPQLVRNPLQATLVDPLLGLLFGYLLALVFTSSPRSRKLTLYLSLGLAMLVLVKDSGSVFAAIVLIAYAWQLIQSERDSRTNWKTAAVHFTAAAMAIMIARMSWSRLLLATDVKAAFQQPMDPRKLLGFFTGDAPAHWPDVIRGYASALFNSPIITVHGLPVTQAVWFVIFAIALVATATIMGRVRGKRPEWAIPVIALGGGAAYTLGLLVLYLYRFRADQALGLASYERYLGTYWIGLATLVTLLLLWSLVAVRTKSTGGAAAERRAVHIVVACWCAALAFLIPMTNAVAAYVKIPLYNAERREPYAIVEEQIERAEIAAGSKVLVLSQDSGDGYEGYVLRYLLIDSAVDVRRPDEANGATVTVPENFTPTEIATYDYLVILSGSPSELAPLDHLVTKSQGVEPGMVYRVERDGGGFKLVLQGS